MAARLAGGRWVIGWRWRPIAPKRHPSPAPSDASFPLMEAASTPAADAHPSVPGEFSVRTTLLVIAIALLLGTVVNAGRLMDGARSKPFGDERDFWVAAWAPFESIARHGGLAAVAGVKDEPKFRPFPSLPAPGLSSPVQAILPDPPGIDTPVDESSDSVASEPPTEPLGPPPPVRRLRTPTPTWPLRLWVGGDSVSEMFGQSLARLAVDTGVITPDVESHVSSGLSRPDYYDWPNRFAAIATTYNPDVFVIMFGANDPQALRTATGQVYSYGTDGWFAEYRARVAGTMDLLRRDQRLVVWVGEPIMGSDTLAKRVQEMNAIYREEAAARPWVVYVDTWDLLADSSGHYASYLPDAGGNPELMRAPDGVHLSRAGGDRLAGRAFDAITAEAGITRP